MGTFDNICEVKIRTRIVTEEMRNKGAETTRLTGVILDFDPYKGLYFAFTSTQPFEERPITLQQMLIYWDNIIDITVLPTKAQRYRKREYYLD